MLAARIVWSLMAVMALAAETGRPSLRRLTHSQYNNTVRDLLGDQTGPASQFPQEDFVHGFKNQVEAQSISPLQAEAYGAAAERLARNYFRGRETPRDGGQFVREFGRKAFRRPLAEAEARRYGALFARGGGQLVVEAMLQSPHFLFRGEGADSRLSYFLWDSMPDDQLLRSAAAGELATAAGIEKAARRMLGDPRARQALDEFVSQWLRFDRVLNTVKDRRLYPQFNPELAYAMTEETRRLVADLVWGSRSFMEIFTAEYGFLNTDLASLYGFPAPGEEFGKVQFPAGSDRAGILGQATLLALTSKPEETSPTERGVFIRAQLLCQEVPDPPPGTDNNLPASTEARPLTNRERLGVHLTNPACATCHQLMDPIGFGLEKFDAVGKRREKQSITFFPGRQERGSRAKAVELEIDTRGAVAGIANSEFSSPKDLGRILAGSAQCQECVVRQLFRYAFGRQETSADRPVIARGLEVFRSSQFRLQELIIYMAGVVR